MESSKKPSFIPGCPYLGLNNDPSTSLTYPSSGNVCYHCKNPVVPKFEYQEQYCLTEEHTECKVYYEPDTKEFPVELKQYPVKPKTQGISWQIPALVIGVILVGVLIWIGYQFISVSPTPSATPIQIVSATNTRIMASPTIPSTPTPKPTRIPPTETALPTETSLPPQVHGLEVPIIVDGNQFVIHMVIAGDQMVFLARDYKTSIEAITALNNGIVQALWVGNAIVIAPGMLTVDPALPAFTTYKVTETEIAIEALAQKLNTDPALLQHYNRCDPGCLVNKGDWLIVPVKK